MTAASAPGARRANGSAWSQFTALQLGQAVALAVGAAAVIVASRVLGPDVYGAYTLFVAVAQYAVILTVSWTTASMVRFGADEMTTSGRLTNAFWGRLAAMVPSIGLIVVALFAARRDVAAAMGIDASMAAIFAMIVALALADHSDSTLQAAGLWKRFAWLGAIEKAVFVAGIGFAGYALGVRSLRAAIAVALAAQAARITVAAVGIARARVVAAPAVHGPTLQRLVAYSWPHLFTFTVGYFSAFVEPFIIKSYLAVRDVGIYQVAFQISLFCGALLSPLSALIFPAVTQLRVQRRREVVVTMLARLVPQFVFVVTMAAIVGMGLARALFVPVFGPQFAAALRPLLILLGALSFQAVVATYSPILAAYDLTKQSAALNT
ncbi:MAG TPA: oligosaccharide flippase family protein, partial [Vicinamibacterales bacterium]|nr:oligosaccharide flippase family protein [Vicinamibacterales bacterium]